MPKNTYYQNREPTFIPRYIDHDYRDPYFTSWRENEEQYFFPPESKPPIPKVESEEFRGVPKHVIDYIRTLKDSQLNQEIIEDVDAETTIEPDIKNGAIILDGPTEALSDVVGVKRWKLTFQDGWVPDIYAYDPIEAVEAPPRSTQYFVPINGFKLGYYGNFAMHIPFFCEVDIYGTLANWQLNPDHWQWRYIRLIADVIPNTEAEYFVVQTFGREIKWSMYNNFAFPPNDLQKQTIKPPLEGYFAGGDRPTIYFPADSRDLIPPNYLKPTNQGEPIYHDPRFPYPKRL